MAVAILFLCLIRYAGGTLLSAPQPLRRGHLLHMKAHILT